MTEPEVGRRASDPSTERVQRLFECLRTDRRDAIRAGALRETLARAGLRGSDPRLAEVLARLDDDELRLEDFRRIVEPDLSLIAAAVSGELVIPDFQGFRERLDEIFCDSARNEAGRVATYIPQLARVDPELHGAAVCTVSGQRHSMGDASTEFCLQSCCKPVLYTLALEENGEEALHARVGREPSGHGFNELRLNRDGLPHNPMINAGSIVCCSMIRAGASMADRFRHVSEACARLAAGMEVGFDNATYLSERETADRNFAIGYFLREHGAFPRSTDLVETLEFYFQCCSIEMSAESLSVLAATLANGGICPLTNERLLAPDTVRKCLSLMYSCGMYDFSGEWAFAVGLPAKSGVAGAILVVVPNVLGICCFSPRLDEHGNSVRGIEFCRHLVATFSFHHYDHLVGGRHDKIDPRHPRDDSRRLEISDLCWAASSGDLEAVRRILARGLDAGAADYDGRTALHLAATRGHEAVARFLLSEGARADRSDHFGRTPLDEAREAGNGDLERLLRESAGS